MGSKCRVQCGTHVITNFILFYLPDLAWLKDSNCKWCTEAFYNGLYYRCFMNAVCSIVLYGDLFMCSTQTFVLSDWAEDVLAWGILLFFLVVLSFA